MDTQRRVTPTMINPDRAGHDRMLQQLTNKYHAEVKLATTYWKTINDRFGDVIAIVPCVRIEFKDGSDYIAELEQNTTASPSHNELH